VEHEADKGVERPMRRFNPIALALLGVAVLLLVIWYFGSNRNPDQDKLTGDVNMSQEASADPEKRCASKATYDLIKRDLFRRAAQVRGSDQPAFDRLSAYAVLRMENPVMESEESGSGAINCSGSLSLDLPPGVAVVGGRRTLTADVDYTLQRAADGSGDVVLLRNADAIVTPLATLARVAQPVQPAAPVATNELAPGQPDELAPQPPSAPTAPQTEPRPVNARPSFDCGNARTRGEIAVCSDAGLAALDRQMAAQFSRAVSIGGPAERALLERTRSRFLAYRDSCRNNACVADSYRGRMREISDIMAGRWQSPR